MKKNIVFVDSTYPEAYDSGSIKQKALGGTEASVIQTARILSKTHRVTVLQRSRHSITVESDSLTFEPLSNIEKISVQVLIILRKYPLALALRKRFPDAKVFLWIHTYKAYEYVFKKAGLARSNITVVCNSSTHQAHTNQRLNGGLLGFLSSLVWKNVPVHYCYNPIVKPKKVELEKKLNKLVFFSSPNKGLEQVLECFKAINATLPELRLYIANPGYKKGRDQSVENTVILGSLPHDEMMNHVSESLCVFYPQDSFAETFGLIYAEANAHGVPVLAHDIGSAKEILHENNLLIDVNNYDQVKSTIESWQKRYPQVAYNDRFSDGHIRQQWTELIKD